ncbi:hypothetical protein WDU94_001892 [Cyamophila willieti]
MAGQGNNNQKRRHSQLSNTSSEFPTRNRFKVLGGLPNDEDDEDMTGDITRISKSHGKIRIPPIIVDGTIQDNNTATQTLKAKLSDTFQYRYSKGKTLVYTNNPDDFKKVKSYLEEKKYGFHTFTLPDEKLLKLVLRGLPPTVTTEDIKEELKEQNFEVVKITQISKHSEYPLYSILFSTGIKAQDILKIKTLCYCVISWEKPHKKPNPTQCYRCQKFHHVAVNCTRVPKCLKCAGDHNVKDCDKVEEEEVKCANCNQKHTANSKECSIFIKVSAQRKNVWPPRDPRKTNSHEEFKSKPNDWPQLYNTPILSSTPMSNPEQRPAPSPTAPRLTQERSQDTSTGLGGIFHEIKSLFQGLNFTKILSTIKSTISKIKKAPDGFNSNSTNPSYVYSAEEKSEVLAKHFESVHRLNLDMGSRLRVCIDSRNSGNASFVSVDQILATNSTNTLALGHSTLSTPKRISAGVPQGSLVGPKLYIFFTHDAPKHKFVLDAAFADDTAMFTSSWRIDTIINRLKECSHRYFSRNVRLSCMEHYM